MFFSSLTFEDARDHLLAAGFFLIGIFLMVSRNEERLAGLRAVSITVASYAEEPLASIRRYRLALETNAELQRQNILLNDELSRVRSASSEIKSLREILDIRKAAMRPMEPVNIVGKTFGNTGSLITIDAGASDSIQIGMPLVTAKGVVGSVTQTAEHYAQILPHNHPVFRISARIQGTRVSGIVSYSGKPGVLLMNYVPATTDVEIGAIIETSGYSNSYPEGVPVGEVVSVEPDPGNDRQRILLKPFQSISDLSEAFIIFFKPDTSLRRLFNEPGAPFQ